MQDSTSGRHFGDPTSPNPFHAPRLDCRRASEPIGFHVTFRLADDRPIATSVAALRTIARVVLMQGEQRGLLAFGTADDHLHAALATDRATAGAFAKYVETALQWRLGLKARFERARIRPLHDQKHAYNTFHYVHRQDARHELGRDHPREGTSLPDLLGLRVLATSIIPRVRTHLPRVRYEDLAFAFPSVPLDQTLTIELSMLPDAAAAALALPELRGRSADVVRARHAAVHAAGHDIRAELVSDCLGITVRAVQGLRATPAEPLVVRAVERQIILRTLARKASDPL